MKTEDEYIEDLGDPESGECWDAIEYFLVHGCERAAPALMNIALDSELMEDSQYYAAQGVLRALGMERFLETFRQELTGPDAKLAMRFMCEFANETALPIMTEFMNSENADLAASAIRFIGRRQDTSQLETIRKLTKSDQPDIKEAAVNALKETDPAFYKQAVLESLSASDPNVRFNAVKELIRRPLEESLDALRATLKDKKQSNEIRFKTVEALAALRHPDSFSDLLAIIEDKDEDEDVRSTAAGSLGVFGRVEAVDPLGKYMLADFDDEFAHGSAAQALGDIDDARAIPHLLAGLKDGRSEVRRWSADALARMDVPDDQKDQISGALLPLLKDEDEFVLEYGIMALGELNVQEAHDRIAAILKERNHLTLFHAIQALGRLGRIEDVPVIAELIYHEDGYLSYEEDEEDGENAEDTSVRKYDTAIYQMVARVLGELKHPDSEKHLRALLRKHGTAEAVHSLGEVGTQDTIAFLLAELEKAPDHENVQKALILGSAAKLGHAPALETLFAMIQEDRDPDHAAFELARNHDPRALTQLEKAIRSQYANTRLSGIQALQTLGAIAPDRCIAVLRAATKDADFSVVKAARTAIAKIKK